MGNGITAEQAAFHPKAQDLTGKNILITGANSGIGKETARVVALKGANVYLACRTKSKAEEAINQIQKELEEKPEGQRGTLHFLQLDLGSLESVRNCAHSFKELDIPLHFLVNNAGIMACPQGKTADGFESQFGTNHLGHFLFTNLLLPELRKGAPSRVINLSSEAHRPGKIHFDDIMFEKRSYSPYKAYANSKLANVLFTRHLNIKLQGSEITTYSLHPGVIPTELGRNNAMANAFYSISKPFIKTIPQGASTTVYCICSPNLESKSGNYFSDCAVKETTKEGKDLKVAEKLWEVSVELVKLTEEELTLAWPNDQSHRNNKNNNNNQVDDHSRGHKEEDHHEDEIRSHNHNIHVDDHSHDDNNNANEDVHHEGDHENDKEERKEESAVDVLDN